MLNANGARLKQYQFSGVFVVLFLIIGARFFYLQIVKSAQYLKASENNRIREIVLEPSRGLIFDRNGNLLVANHPSYSVTMLPIEAEKSDTVLCRLGKILQMSPSEIKEIIRKKKVGKFQPVKIKRQIDFPTLAQIEEGRLDLPNVDYQIEPRRYYAADVRASHMLGYLGEIATDELKESANKNLQYGDIIGKKGIEKVYDEELRGTKGYSYFEVDVLGRVVRKLAEKKETQPIPGKNLYLTIDIDLQRSLEQLMEEKRGGAVLVNCAQGEILAMVSKPDFDPDLFAQVVSSDVWENILNDPNKPLYDRVLQSIYPPGSTYKLITAIAALEKRKIGLGDTVNCGGYYQFGSEIFECWNHEGHGKVSLLDAIERSCNVYFYKLGLKVGIEDWSAFSKELFFGEPTGIDLVEEKSGLLPDIRYFDNKFGAGKTPKGTALNLAIGQGDLLVTPLQMVRLAMIIANEGIYPKLHLVRYIEDPIEQEKWWTKIDSMRTKNISRNTYALLKLGMYRAVHGPKGTAVTAYCQDLEVAGKTGTAQNPHGQPHSWFIGFAPCTRPEIAICVLVENGGSGSRTAAPIAKKLIEEYFNMKNFAHARL